jgi:zinc protease
MKVKKCSIVIALAVIFLFGSLDLNAARKRKVDKIKFPPLNKIHRPEVKKAQTSNGIKLRLIKTEKLPLVNLLILVKGGSHYDPGTKVGLASVTAQLLRIGGTKELKPEEVDKRLDSKGIDIDIDAGDDYYTINLSCLEENFDEAVSFLSKILLQPAFDREKMEEIKTQLRSAISRRNDNPMPINRREFNKLIYGEKTPFAAVLEYEHMDNIVREDVHRTYKTFFAPGNMLAGVTGPLEMERFKEIFETHFGSWSHQAQIPAYPQVREQTHDFKVAFARKSNLNQSYFSIGHLGVKEDLSRSAKFLVFNSIFSQGFTSRLVSRVRVKMGLTYGIGGGINTERLYPGTTSYTTFTKSESTIDAIKAIFDEMDIIRKEKVTQQELNDAKDSFLNAYVFEFSTPEKVLQNSLRREFYGVDVNIIDRLVEDVKTVTADDILEVAKNYLHPDKMIVSVVGNKEKIKGDLSELGKVKELDISIKPPALKEKIPEPTPGTLQKGTRIIMELAKKKYKKYKHLKSLEMKANMKMTMMGRTMDMGLKSTTLFPGKKHSEISVMGIKIERIINGKKGIMKQMGMEKAISEEEIEKGEFDDLYNIFHSKGKYKFQYLKEKEIDGKKYDVIYIFDAKKRWMKYFINRETGLIEIEEKLSDVPGQTGVSRTVKSGFKTVKGIPFAFKSEVFVEEKKVGEVTIKEIKVNPEVDPSIFTIEEKK